MKAIRTRYYGPTNTRGAKIIATDGDHNSLTLSYPYGASDPHELAAYLLMQKMGWSNRLVGGGFKNDYYWTMIPRAKDEVPVYVTYLQDPKLKEWLVR